MGKCMVLSFLRKWKVNQSTVQYVIEPCLNIWHAKLRLIYPCLANIYPQNRIGLYHFLFELRFWAFLNIARHSWNPEIKLVQKYTFFIWNKIENLTLSDPEMTWPFPVVGLRGIRLQNSSDFWILRAKVIINHVPHARKKLILVTFRDLTLTLTRT